MRRSLLEKGPLLLALTQLRLGLLYGDLDCRFSISPAGVCKIFHKVLKALHKMMSYIVVWLSSSRIQRRMPQCTTCILDCTEVSPQRQKKKKKQVAKAQT